MRTPLIAAAPVASTRRVELIAGPGQVSVLQTAPHTGVPLTRDGRWATGEQVPTERFASLADAELACRSRVHERPDTEWWLYDHDGAPIKRIADDAYWQSRVAAAIARRSRGFWRRLLDRLRGR